MADLITQTVTYKQLADQYANFIVPAVKIKVNGADVLKTKKLVIHEMEVTLVLDQASSAVIKFAHIYDEESHSFESKIKSAFQLGTIAEIEFGYLSKTQKVFQGYVEMAGAEMGESELFVITLMDVKRLMMISGKKSVLYNVPNYSDAFRKVIGSYSALCSPQIDATSDQLEEPIPQTDNDYAFVEHELIGKGKAEREFIVLAGKAYFRKTRKITAPITTLRYGRELLDLSISHCYRDMKIEVLDVAVTETFIKGQAQIKANMPQKNLVIPTPVCTLTDPYADTKDKADAKAESAARQERERSSIGSGTTLGLPELVPGRFIKIENVDALFDRTYYITEVIHVYSGESFRTQFEIGGC